VNRKTGEGLRRALREANVREGWLTSRVEDISNAVGNIVESKLIDGEVPELKRSRRAVDRLLRVFVATIVPQLYPLLALRLCQLQGYVPKHQTLALRGQMEGTAVHRLSKPTPHCSSVVRDEGRQRASSRFWDRG